MLQYHCRSSTVIRRSHRTLFVFLYDIRVFRSLFFTPFPSSCLVFLTAKVIISINSLKHSPANRFCCCCCCCVYVCVCCSCCCSCCSFLLLLFFFIRFVCLVLLTSFLFVYCCCCFPFIIILLQL